MAKTKRRPTRTPSWKQRYTVLLRTTTRDKAAAAETITDLRDRLASAHETVTSVVNDKLTEENFVRRLKALEQGVGMIDYVLDILSHLQPPGFPGVNRGAPAPKITFSTHKDT
ncbi:MAG TPA: hypothetical protein VN903_11155 [Polyangia bacterium]|nr:hypothetical protein [Polyangia bacterium]